MAHSAREHSEVLEAVIGLEVHVQLATETKIFCGCSTSFGAQANTQVCPVCLGLPGALPVLNKKVVEYALKMGLATHCRVNRQSIFARKNYFYPDLPKGYQISQYETPLCENGYLEIRQDDEIQRVDILRIHMEEDAGKSIHEEQFTAENESLIDLNRCGVPLIEIVSAPQLHSPQQARAYLMATRQLVRYLGISDGNMEEGSLRCDANVSVRHKGEQKLNIRTELKNMNSFNHVEKALQYEIDRQSAIIKNGGSVIQETLLWDNEQQVARTMRGKEESPDYRYFPDPDLVPVVVRSEWLDEIHRSLPELPLERAGRFKEEYHLPSYDAALLTEHKEVADYYEVVLSFCNDPKLVSNWVMGEVLRRYKERGFIALPAMKLGNLLNRIKDRIISSSAAKTVFNHLRSSDKSVDELIQYLNLNQLTDEVELEALIEDVLRSHGSEVDAYRKGKKKLLRFFTGQVMRISKGRADPVLVNQILRKKLEK